MTTKKRMSKRKFYLILQIMIGAKWLNYTTIILSVILLISDITSSSTLIHIHKILATINPIALVFAITICILFILHPIKHRKIIISMSIALLLGLLSIFDSDFKASLFPHNEVVSISQHLLNHLGNGQFDVMGNDTILTFVFYTVAIIFHTYGKYYGYQFLMLTGLSIPFTASLGYFFDIKQLHLLMSVSTVTICFMVAMSGLGLSANKGALRLFLTPNLVGLVARTQYLLSLSFCILVGIALPNMINDSDFVSSYEIFVTLTTIFISLLIYASTIILGQSEQKKQQAEKQMKELIITDPLTGLYNRRGLDDEIRKSLNYQSRYGGDISILILDLDYFKSVNDNFGHDIGDLFLKTVAAVIKSKVRQNDVVSRYGGEEFLVLLPNTSEKQAKSTAEKLRLAIESSDFSSLCGKKYHQTVSIGGTTISPLIPNIQSSIKKADQMLYEAKSRGRNCSVLHCDAMVC